VGLGAKYLYCFNKEVIIMKVLITGCAGFIGSHLAKHFLKKNVEVFGIDDLSRKGTQLNLDDLSVYDGFEFFKVDIRNNSDVEEVFKNHGEFELIIHEAGQVAVTTSVADPRTDFEINALGTFNLLEATRLYSPDAFFEFASTNKVYGKMDEVTVVEKDGRYMYEDLHNGVPETQNLDFHSPYGCSKGVADQYVRDYSRIYGLKTVVLRQSCIYGTHQFGVEDQGWVAWFVIASILEKEITIYGDGMQGRDLLWIDDLVDVYVALYENADSVSGEIYNVGGGANNILSLLELVETLKKDGVLAETPEFDDWRPGDQKIFVSDISKLKKDIGWEPKVDPSLGVEKLLNWCRENKNIIASVINN
jgi:CDP-paratose 2-epimerase